VLTRDGAALSTLDGTGIERVPSRVAGTPPWPRRMAIPTSCSRSLRAAASGDRHVPGRIDEELGSAVLADANLERREIRRLRRVVLVACGTSYNAGSSGGS